ncbi:MAG TPA: SIMPL domain-containing protein [Candidatus Nitrosocosmicus sp.]|nr:SIMPL domain-containing protein [Candidatus Nitrosocosmicus sp.]
MLIGILPLSVMTSNITIVQAQSFVLAEEKPTVSTTGIAEKEIPSDESRISLAVENTNANPSTARENNADKMNTIIRALKQAGLSDENVTTSNFQITPNYDSENSNYDSIISYTALNKIELKTSANANISKFIDLAVNNGANRVENIDFVISEETLDTINLQLLKDAYRNAKQKAEILASEGNFTITGVKKIDTSTEGGYIPPVYFYDNYAGDDAEKMPSPSTHIIPQKNKITVTLPVIFYIGNQTR